MGAPASAPIDRLAGLDVLCRLTEGEPQISVRAAMEVRRQAAIAEGGIPEVCKTCIDVCVRQR